MSPYSSLWYQISYIKVELWNVFNVWPCQVYDDYFRLKINDSPASYIWLASQERWWSQLKAKHFGDLGVFCDLRQRQLERQWKLDENLPILVDPGNSGLTLLDIFEWTCGFIRSLVRHLNLYLFLSNLNGTPPIIDLDDERILAAIFLVSRVNDQRAIDKSCKIFYRREFHFVVRIGNLLNRLWNWECF